MDVENGLVLAIKQDKFWKPFQGLRWMNHPMVPLLLWLPRIIICSWPNVVAAENEPVIGPLTRLRATELHGNRILDEEDTVVLPLA